jgi:hypothetical protein
VVRRRRDPDRDDREADRRAALPHQNVAVPFTGVNTSAVHRMYGCGEPPQRRLRTHPNPRHHT